MTKNVHPSVISQTFSTTWSSWAFHNLKLLSLVQRLRYVHYPQATLISYTFLVADYWSSTVTLSYTSNFDSLVKSELSYCLATLQHISRIHSAFYGNSFFTRSTNVSKRLSLAPKQVGNSALQVGCQTRIARCMIIHSAWHKTHEAL